MLELGLALGVSPGLTEALGAGLINGPGEVLGLLDATGLVAGEGGGELLATGLELGAALAGGVPPSTTRLEGLALGLGRILGLVLALGTGLPLADEVPFIRESGSRKAKTKTVMTRIIRTTTKKVTDMPDDFWL